MFFDLFRFFSLFFFLTPIFQDVSSLDQSMELDESQADFSDEDGITFTNSSG